ncbi:protein regulator of cytokinesis 1-like [Drosophila elegans]|uniref:protein regulator of cytokinesis 1-like n=1 Tax=Drosophila elegans TaxID=30023 RepID=UPI0007E6FA67|nr:protein regulator of cytokinesis 1-like [Drosophila elegans]
MNTSNAATLKAQIVEMTGEHVEELHAMWSRMFEPKTCDEFLHKLHGHTHSFFTDLINESREKQQGILAEIATLEAEASDLTRLLHDPVDIGPRPDDMPLVVWQLKLDKSIEQLREERARRQAEIRELLLQQEQLCEELGEMPRSLLADPLPLPTEMDSFRDHVQQLGHRREKRLEEMHQLRQSIRHNMKLLDIHVMSDTESRLLSRGNQCVSPASFERLRLLHTEYADQVKEMHVQIDVMRGKIDLLWQRLKITDEFAMRPVREATSYNQRTYDVLREELHRCQQMRRKNIKTFIEQLRLEIKELWALTLKSPQECQSFVFYSCDNQSEDVLEAFEMELDELKSYYNSNRKIFDLYANRVELWSRMAALEAKSNDPNRFNNRGGQLLKEERERKAMSCQLPKIDQQITELVNAYTSHTGRPFLVNGVDILESMSADWEVHRQSKKQPSAQKKDSHMTASIMKRPMAPLTPNTFSLKGNCNSNVKGSHGSSSSLKKTPSKMNSSAVAAAAKSTGNLQKRRHSNNEKSAAAAKRNLITSLDCQPATLAVPDGQKPLKSPQKKVRVLEYSVRRNRANGKKRPIPRVHVQPPTSEENESDLEPY